MWQTQKQLAEQCPKWSIAFLLSVIKEALMDSGTFSLRKSLIFLEIFEIKKQYLRKLSVSDLPARRWPTPVLSTLSLEFWTPNRLLITRRSSVQIRLPQPEGKTRYLRIPSLFLLIFTFSQQTERLRFRPNEAVLFGQHIVSTDHPCTHPPSARCRRGQRVLWFGY